MSRLLFYCKFFVQLARISIWCQLDSRPEHVFRLGTSWNQSNLITHPTKKVYSIYEVDLLFIQFLQLNLLEERLQFQRQL